VWQTFMRAKCTNAIMCVNNNTRVHDIMYECELYNNTQQRCARLSVKNLAKTHIKDIVTTVRAANASFIQFSFTTRLHCLHCDDFHRISNRRVHRVVTNDRIHSAITCDPYSYSSRYVVGNDVW